MLRKRLLPWIFLPLLTGCQTTPCDTCGMIEVSSPQVFTRERLIEDRWRETQWLNQKLATEFKPTVQGLRELRLTSQLIAGLKADLKPLPSGHTDVGGKGTSISAPPETPPNDPRPKSGSSNSQTSTAPLDILGLESVTDERAFRDGIAALLRERQLNDTHDLNGNTLYELKFDISLFPPERANRYGIVKLSMVRPPQEYFDNLPKRYPRAYDQFVDALGREIARESIWLQVRARENGLSDETWAMVHAALNNQESDSQESVSQTCRPAAHQEQERRLACYVRQKYLRYFGTVASILEPNSTAINGRQLFISSVTNKEDGARNLYQYLKERTEQDAKRVGTVEPKEYVQNISDLASRANLRDLALSLAATLPNGMEPSAYVRSINSSQQLLQGILRKPLLVSFNNTVEFGWLLGPKFTIDDGKADFKFTPVRHSVTASIEVPAHWPLICLTGEYYWLDAQGNPARSMPLWIPQRNNKRSESADTHRQAAPPAEGPTQIPQNEDGKPQVKECAENSLRVDLVPDAGLLIASALQNPRDRSFLKPRIEVSKDIHLTQSLHPISKSPHYSLLIVGKNVWRNPAVFLGSVKADYVEIQPDMEGLLAYFPESDIQSLQAEGSAPLTVVTTFGSDIIRMQLPRASKPPK